MNIRVRSISDIEELGTDIPSALDKSVEIRT